MTGLMKQARRSGFTKWEFLVVVCVIGVLTTFFIKDFWNSKGPAGKTIPVTSPREENRFFHPLGLSFIAPPNWDSNLIMEYHQEVPWLSVAPRDRLFTRFQRASFGCKLIDPPQTEQLSEYVRVKFQGFPAYERMYVWRQDSFDAPASSVYYLLVDRNGQWWQIYYEIADETITLPPIMREYFDTIRFPPKAVEVKELSKSEKP